MRFALALLFLVRLAHADVGVVVTGDPNMQARVLDVAQRWLQDKKYALAAAPLGAASQQLADCFVMEDMTCAKKLIEEKATSTTVVFVRVDLVTGATRDYTLAAYWFANGAEPVAEKRTCANCDDAALETTVGALMTDLSAKGAQGKGRLKIASGGTPMTVKIDGNEVGTPPIDREVDAGSHELVFLHGGSPVDVRRVDVGPGATVELTAPHVVDEKAPVGGRRSRVLPGLLIAGGLVAAAAGGVFLYYGSLRGPDEPYVYTNATEIGLPLALAGAFAVGAGTSLWFSGSGSDAQVGVSGSF